MWMRRVLSVMTCISDSVSHVYGGGGLSFVPCGKRGIDGDLIHGICPAGDRHFSEMGILQVLRSREIPAFCCSMPLYGPQAWSIPVTQTPTIQFDRQLA